MGVHSETIVVHHVAGEGVIDAHGVEKPLVQDVTLYQVTMQPASVRATVVGGDEAPAEGRWMISTSAPVGEDQLAKGDTLTWRGDEYLVSTIPHTFWQELPHTEVIVTRTKG